jgi:4-hydroxybenzoate polyprenyltransferase
MIAYLKLIRLPNAFTAIADIVAGTVIGAAVPWGRIPEWSTIAILSGASACLYLSGMAFNDFADRKEDAKYRPSRPIPSGKVSLPGALICAVVLMAGGVGLAALMGKLSLIIAAALAGFILLYDFAAKGIPVAGALTLGACRFCNVMLGLSVDGWMPASTLSGSPLFLPLAPALVVGLYAAGLTAFSAQEEEGKDRRAGILGWLFVDAALLFGMVSVPNHAAWTVFALIWITIFYFSYRLRVEGTPIAARNLIRTGVMGICVLDAGLIIGFAGLEYAPWAAGCVTLLIPGLMIGKWLAQKEA